MTPVPAIGMLNVCVEPDEDILKPKPEVPTEKYCVYAVRPFNVVSPVAATVNVVHAIPDVLAGSAIRY